MIKEVKSDILNQHTEEDGQNTTPLIIAAKKGNTNVVVSLLKVLRSVDLERTGGVNFRESLVKKRVEELRPCGVRQQSNILIS